MTIAEVVPCRLAHVRRLAMNLRAGDLAELLAMGGQPRHHLFRLWRRTVDPWAMLIDGEVAAAGGDAGDLLSPDGEAWLFTTYAVERMPLAYVRELRRCVRVMLERRRRLMSDVRCEYEQAQRLFRLLGFHVKHPDDRGWCRMSIEA